MEKSRIQKMTFTPHSPPQKKAEMEFEFENHGGKQTMRIALDKTRVWHQYEMGDKDLLRLQRRLNAHIKNSRITCKRGEP